MKLSRMTASYTWPQGDHPDAGDFGASYYMSTFPREVDPDSIVPPCEHKHTTSNGASLCSRKRQLAAGVGDDGRNTFTVADVGYVPPHFCAWGANNGYTDCVRTEPTEVRGRLFCEVHAECVEQDPDIDMSRFVVVPTKVPG